MCIGQESRVNSFLLICYRAHHLALLASSLFCPVATTAFDIMIITIIRTLIGLRFRSISASSNKQNNNLRHNNERDEQHKSILTIPSKVIKSTELYLRVFDCNVPSSNNNSIVINISMHSNRFDPYLKSVLASLPFELFVCPYIHKT